jgi:hypothetical protein
MSTKKRQIFFDDFQKMYTKCFLYLANNLLEICMIFFQEANNTNITTSQGRDTFTAHSEAEGSKGFCKTFLMLPSSLVIQFGLSPI